MTGDSNSNAANASSLMSTTKLTSINYGSWVDEAGDILQNRGLWEIVTAPLPAPTSTNISSTQTPISSSPPESDESKQLDAADALILMISDEILGRLTSAEESHGQKLWHRVIQMLRPVGIQRYIALQREYQSLRRDPDSEILQEFLDHEKMLRDEITATGVKPTDDLRTVIFLLSSMPSK